MATMADDEVVSLLREIRDLQKLHVENYQDALRNQQVSIEMQAKALLRQKRSLLILVGIVLLGLAIAVLPSLLGHH